MKVKAPTTFMQQVDNLIKKGVIVQEPDLCRDFFSRVNYYRFSAYFLPFRKSDKTYHVGTTFEQAHKIYIFDAKMRNLIFRAIEEIEMSLRTQLAYVHSHKYGAIGYKDAQNFNDYHRHEAFEIKVANSIKENINSPVVKHHESYYEGQFPLWVIIEFFSTSTLSYFYSDLKLPEQKDIARRLYNTTPQHVMSWLKCLTDLRNRCAHHSRLYYWLFASIPKMPSESSHIATRRLFEQILVLKYLFPSKQDWNNCIFPSITALVDDYMEVIELAHIGFPIDWEKMLSQ
jgi:abortive infection bacteriophage resistance protein